VSTAWGQQPEVQRMCPTKLITSATPVCCFYFESVLIQYLGNITPR